MDNIVDIKSLSLKFQEEKSLEEWKSFASMQNDLIERYQKEIEVLGQKNRQLELMLINKSSLITQLSAEENICIQQINHLENESNKRPLTLEEVKRLDLLVKNLKLIREGNTLTIKSNPLDELGDEELVAIATRTE